MGFSLSGMGIALIRDITLAAKLGTTVTADALFVGLALPLLVDTLIRQGVKSSVIPLLVDHNAQDPSEGLRPDLASELLSLGIICGLTLTIVMECLAPVFIKLLAPGFEDTTFAAAVTYLRISSLLVIFAPLATLMSSILDAEKKFSYGAMRTAIVAGVTLLITLATWELDNIAHWISAAYVCGFITASVFLLATLYKYNYRYNVCQGVSRGTLIALTQSTLWPLSGHIARQLIQTLQFTIASLVGTGTISTFYFAGRITSGVQTIIGSSLATTALPTLTECYRSNNRAEYKQILVKTLKYSIALTLPILLFLLVGGRIIVEVIYGRGEFDLDSIQQTSQVLRLTGLGLIFAVLIPILQATLYSKKKYGLIFIQNLMSSILGITIKAGFALRWGLIGLAASAPVASFLSVMILTRLLRYGDQSDQADSFNPSPES